LKYWENEQSTTATTHSNIIRYFPKAGKLQISRPYWSDASGAQHPGKTVTLDIEAAKGNPDALAIFKAIYSLLCGGGKNVNHDDSRFGHPGP
jgi:hypothetical protein